MPHGCSAGYCTNSNKKGFQMCPFPKNSERRKIWIQNINRIDWIPTLNARLCDVHFTPHMWITRKDGSRRLKSDAVPTIFSENLPTSLTRQNLETRTEAAMIEPDVLEDTSNKMEEISEEESITTEEKNDVLNIPSNGEGTSDPCVLRLERLEMLWKRSERLRFQMKKKLQQAKRKIKRLEAEVCKNRISLNISNIFNEDQLCLLSAKYKKMPNWCNDTLIKAYKLKFACGTKGYEELLKANFPLPSIRTLSRKLESLKFESGVISEIFEFMKIKISGFEKEIDKDCTLVLDEMSITPGSFYDSSTNTIFGNVTLPDHDESLIATHSLVFMLAGIASRWKQTVAYYYTGNRVNGEKLKPIVETIIKKAEEIGLFVHNVTSDMGPSNQAMWRAFGIQVSNVVVQNSCKHPCSSDRLLYFYSDVPHALKNIKSGFVNNETITIPDCFINRYALPTNVASCSHLNDVLTADENCDIKLAPKFRSEYLSRNNHFQKMRVNTATRVLSDQVGTTLELLAEGNSNDARITTAWFLKFIARWFRIMSGRNCSLALGFKHVQKFEETIAFLNEVIEFFTDIKVGQSGHWKPFQTAVIMSTTTVIQLTSVLLRDRSFDYFLPSRLSQDCIENLFSVIRLKNVIPNAVQFKNNSKLISISQYMKSISNSNYEDDDREFFSEFLDILIKNSKSVSESKQVQVLNVIPEKTVFSKLELNKIYHVSGYLIASIIKNQTVCQTCINATGSLQSKNYYYSALTRLRNKHANALFFVNPVTFNFFLQMTRIFKTFYPHIRFKKNVNLKEFLIKLCNKITFSLPACHNLKENIIKRFIAFKLKNCSKAITPSNKNAIRASKSMVMHAYIK